jgi:hypothetical protein
MVNVNGLPWTNTLAYLANSEVRKSMKCCEFKSTKHIHNTPFSLQLMSRTNKLEYYITLGWKSLPGTNTLAY